MLYRYSGDKYTREVVFVNIRRYSEIDAVNITICRERPSDFHTCVSLYHAAHKLLYQIHSYQMLKSIIVHQNCEHKQFFIDRSFFLSTKVVSFYYYTYSNLFENRYFFIEIRGLDQFNIIKIWFLKKELQNKRLISPVHSL